MNYQDALDRALSLSHDPDALEAYLQTVPSWRADLERATAVSRSVSRRLGTLTPADATAQRSQQRLMSVVSRLATAESGAALARRAGLLGLFAMHRLAVAGVVAAALLVLVFAANLPSLSGGGTQTAEALVIEGNVAEISTNGVTISTNSTSQLVKLDSNTVLKDGFGNTAETSKLSAGQDVVLEGNRSGDDFVASEVQLRDWLFGVVTALPGDGIHLSSDSGDYVLQVTSDTRFEGVVNVGAFIEVKVIRLSDGSLLAIEVETEDDGGENENQGGDGDQESSGPPLTSPVAAASPSSNSGPSEDGGQKKSEGGDSSHDGSSHEDGGSKDGSENGDD